MMPYLASDLAVLMKDLVSLFVKPEVVEENKSAWKLATLDVTKSENLLPAKKVAIGNGTHQALESSKIKPLQNLQFCDDTRGILKSIIKKLQDRCPLKYSLVRALVSIDPQQIVRDKITTTTQFETVTKKFAEGRLLTNHQCDSAQQQYRRFVDDKMPELKKFDSEKDRLDEFYHTLMSDIGIYNHLWDVVQRILVVSHGQAVVERGFSVNDDMLLQNMKQPTLVARRLIHDTMTSLGISVHEFKIEDQLLRHCA